MYALLDENGKGIVETTLCGLCVEDPSYLRQAYEWAHGDETWDGDTALASQYFVDGATCTVCGQINRPDE